MEPFGLLNLLKSALIPNPDDTLLAKTENNDKPVEDSSAKPEPISEPVKNPNNACLDFINRHEERAGRQRRR
jgi:hypothetical protein